MSRLTKNGRWMLKYYANSRKCIYCGRFISYQDMSDGKVGWHDPTSAMDEEPREEQPYHKSCQLADIEANTLRLSQTTGQPVEGGSA